MIIFLVCLQVLLLGLQMYCLATSDRSGTDFKSKFATFSFILNIAIMFIVQIAG